MRRRFGPLVRELGITGYWKSPDSAVFIRMLRPRGSLHEERVAYATPKALERFEESGYRGIINVGIGDGAIEFKDRRIRVSNFWDTESFYRFLEQKAVEAKAARFYSNNAA